MQTFTTASGIQSYLKAQKNKTIGFVATMGALHAGHLSLVQESKKKCDLTVVSIFVNPTQFAPNEDLDKYPRPIEQDKALLEKEKVDVLFLPSVEEVYPNLEKPPQPVPKLREERQEVIANIEMQDSLSKQLKQSVHNKNEQHSSACCAKLELPEFTKTLEGASRPTHFLGVAEVVKRLFEIIEPTDTFFGQKDFQQTLVIKWLIKSFQFNIKLHVCLIIREKEGLALSSRNQYLNPEEKKAALILKETLGLAQKLVNSGEDNVQTIEQAMQKNIQKEPLASLDYATIRNQNDLKQQEFTDYNSIALIAAKVGKTRLLDNTHLSQ